MLRDTSKYCVSKFEKSALYDNESTYIYSSAIRSFKDERIITGGIAVVFDSTPQFNAMLDESLPRDIDGNKISGIFALFTDKDKKIISSTNDNFQVDSYLNIDDKFFNLKNAQQKSQIIEMNNKYYGCVFVSINKGEYVLHPKLFTVPEKTINERLIKKLY